MVQQVDIRPVVDAVDYELRGEDLGDPLVAEDGLMLGRARDRPDNRFLAPLRRRVSGPRVLTQDLGLDFGQVDPGRLGLVPPGLA